MRIQAFLICAFCAAACGRAALVRDQITVRRGSVSEEWRLEWRNEPKETWITPCFGAEESNCREDGELRASIAARAILDGET